MSRIVLVAGHGDGDPGAVGNGTYEARETRRIVNALAQRIPGAVVYPTTRNLFRARDWNFFRTGDVVIEWHLNAFSNATAHGTEILIRSGFTLDARGRRIIGSMSRFFARRRLPSGVMFRSDLQNMNVFAQRGIWYVLPELCFITNTNDMRIYNSRFNEIMDDIARAITGGAIQPPPTTQPPTTPPPTNSNFRVRVTANLLNIRAGSGTNHRIVGSITDRGVYTITEVRQGVGSTAGWGRLLSGAGWISLDFATRR
jgi:hypothetical protein